MTVIDQLGREVHVPFPPQRIVSLVPSQTELLYDLGLAERVVGITKFCVHPEEWFRNKPRVGGTKNVNLDAVRSLLPNLIIANKEENEQSQIEALAKEFPVWVSDVNDLTSGLEMITSIAKMTDTMEKGAALTRTISSEFEAVRPQKKSTVVYLIWKDPFMAAGSDTFIHDMMQRCGFRNLVGTGRYPEVSENQLQDLQPELLLLSSEPYPFKEEHIRSLKVLLPDTEVLLVDGEMFSWYGSRLTKAPSYFRNLLAGL